MGQMDGRARHVLRLCDLHDNHIMNISEMVVDRRDDNNRHCKFSTQIPQFVFFSFAQRMKQPKLTTTKCSC